MRTSAYVFVQKLEQFRQFWLNNGLSRAMTKKYIFNVGVLT